MNPYETLGVEHDADDEAIKQAHRREVRKHHPDTGGDPKKMLALNQAIDILRDPDKRRRYDETGRTDQDPNDPRAKQLKFLTTAFTECVDQMANVETTDLIAKMKHWFDDRRRTGEELNRNSQAERAKLEKVLKRLKFSGKGENILGRVLEQRIVEYSGMIASMSEQLETLKEARKLVAEYLYEVTMPAPPPPPPPGFWDGPMGEAYRSDTVAGWTARNRQIRPLGQGRAIFIDPRDIDDGDKP